MTEIILFSARDRCFSEAAEVRDDQWVWRPAPVGHWNGYGRRDIDQAIEIIVVYPFADGMPIVVGEGEEDWEIYLNHRGIAGSERWSPGPPPLPPAPSPDPLRMETLDTGLGITEMLVIFVGIMMLSALVGILVAAL